MLVNLMSKASMKSYLSFYSFYRLVALEVKDTFKTNLQAAWRFDIEAFTTY